MQLKLISCIRGHVTTGFDRKTDSNFFIGFQLSRVPDSWKAFIFLITKVRCYQFVRLRKWFYIPLLYYLSYQFLLILWPWDFFTPSCQEVSYLSSAIFHDSWDISAKKIRLNARCYFKWFERCSTLNKRFWLKRLSFLTRA